jgi:hypothetical protein
MFPGWNEDGGRFAAARAQDVGAETGTTWGVILPVGLASPTALLKPFLTEATGLPSNSTKPSAINFNRSHRRMWASNRGGTGAGVWRFFVARLPICLR